MQASSLRPTRLCTLVTLSVLPAYAVQAADWWFQAGPVYRTGMAVRVSGSSYTQTQGLHAAPPVPPADSETYADRTYDDGYVKLDPGTPTPRPSADPASPGTGPMTAPSNTTPPPVSSPSNEATNARPSPRRTARPEDTGTWTGSA